VDHSLQASEYQPIQSNLVGKINMRKVGRYEILEEIGHGGQSVAFKARDPKIDRVVAIKQIRS
jgi:serine/threonine protein kinase